MELGIAQAARASGTTSRTLRHYHEVGLLAPSRVGANGYRYYDDAALRRLQRILLLRELGLGVAEIARVVDATGEAAALRAHLEWLRAEQARLGRQIVSVQRTIASIGSEEAIMAEEMFDGFDNSVYREEVIERWGNQAWNDGQQWWSQLGEDGRRDFTARHQAIAARWVALWQAGEPTDSAAARANAEAHHHWIAEGWAGREPTADELVGLTDMYVADARFAANYGGVEGAEYVREALTHYVLTDLT